MRADDLRAYANRDWEAIQRLKEESWLEEIRGWDEGRLFRLAQRLVDEVREVRPEWPDDKSRDADFRHHLRLAELLARASAYRRR